MDNYTFVHTSCLDAADGEVQTEVKAGLTKEKATECFNLVLKKLMDEILSNRYLKVTIRLREFKALVKIEGIHHVVAVTEED